MSRRFIKFAQIFSLALPLVAIMLSCKGRTSENMVPTGDTVEVVIMQDTTMQINQQIITNEIN